MDYLYDLVSSFSGRRSTQAEEREEALQNVRHFTGREGRRGRRAALDAPEDGLPVPGLVTPMSGAFAEGTNGEQSPVRRGAFDVRRRSLDSMSTSIFGPTMGHSTPGREVRPLGLNTDRQPLGRQDSSLNPNTPPFTDGSVNTPGPGVQTIPKAVRGGNQVGGGLTQNTVEGPSSLPLDSTLIMDMRPTPPPYQQETELESARRELEEVVATREKFLREVNKNRELLTKLNQDLDSQKTEVDKLVQQRIASETEVANLHSLGKELDGQVHEARNELRGIRSTYQKVKGEVIQMGSQIPVSQIPASMAATCTVATGMTPSVPTVLPSVDTAGRPVPYATRNTDGSYLATPGTGSVYESVSTPNMVTYQQVARVPIPKPRSRQGLTPTQKATYDRNPAIEAMGIDIVPLDVNESDVFTPKLDFGDIKHPDAARQKAIEVPAFTGNPPWRKYKVRFEGIIDSNRWNNQQALVALKQALSGGPGEPALRAFQKVKTKTLESLLETAEWAIGKIGEHDPRTQLLKRVQLKDEHLRSYGFALQELIAECYRGCRLDTPTVIQELTSRFVNGVRDTDLQAYLREKWQPDLSLAELFNHADVYDTKRAVFPGLGVSATSTGVPSVAATGVVPAEKKTKGKTATREVASVTTEQDIEKMFEAYMLKHVEKVPVAPTSSSSKKNQKKKAAKPQPCRRCQKMGHWASECTAPAPIAAKTEKGAGN